jgi:hypothetical protein
MKSKKWVATLGIGLLSKWAISWIFDFLLYPFIISIYGILLGGLIMTVLSFLICYLLVVFYDITKKDWIGIETLKKIEDFTPKKIPEKGINRFVILTINAIGNFSALIMKKSDALLLILLSIKFDPFITVVHIRHGSHQYNGLSRRDWKIFITSVIIGNVYWTLAVYMGITIFEMLWQFIVRFL